MTAIRKVWIMTVPVLCTSHIPPDQIDQLEVPNSVAHDLGGDGYPHRSQSPDGQAGGPPFKAITRPGQALGPSHQRHELALM